MLIGLTGGIGCGKSTAATEFAALGFRVEDTDRIVREDVLPSADVVAQAVGRWGEGVLLRSPDERLDCASGYRLDRARVADKIFADARERLWWEQVVHPRVRAVWRGRVALEPEAKWLVEIPLLFEAGLEKGFDFIVCVGANPDVQVARAVARGMTQAQACRRIASQIPLATKLHSAHAVLWNDGSREFLRAQVAVLATDLLQGR